MNQQVDDQFLEAMGLSGLQGEAKEKALNDILYTININVGNRVADILTDEQLEDFERLSRPGADPEKLVLWLRHAIPDYQQMVEEEIKKLRDDTLSLVDKVMGK